MQCKVPTTTMLGAHTCLNGKKRPRQSLGWSSCWLGWLGVVLHCVLFCQLELFWEIRQVNFTLFGDRKTNTQSSFKQNTHFRRKDTRRIKATRGAYPSDTPKPSFEMLITQIEPNNYFLHPNLISI